MITSFEKIYSDISGKTPIPIAVVNPINKDIFKATERAEHKGWIIPILFNDDNPGCAAERAIQSVRDGTTKLLMKGDLETSLLLKKVLSPENGLRIDNQLIHIAVMESEFYPKLILVSDGGVNLQLSKKVVDSIIENSKNVTKCFGIAIPKIAMLTLIEKVTKSLPETLFAESTAKRWSKDKTVIIEGPVALDVALNRKAAAAKNILSRISGETDVLIGPGITATNMMVKALINLGNVRVGGIILGAQTPLVLLSRSDNPDTKLNSIALGLLMLKNEKHLNETH